MRRPRENSFWQSYSDLAMGLVGVLALILVLLLLREKQESKRLSEERKQFAADLLELMERGQWIIRRQDDVENWMESVFEQGDCALRLRDGRLGPAGSNEQAAELYESGKVDLSIAAEAALRSCAQNFFHLATCLSPVPEAQERCRELEAELAVEQGRTLEDEWDLETFRGGIEALVLQGNTDRIAFRGSPAVRYRSEGSELTEPLTSSFVSNAFLGAERARQALAHLLDLLEDHGTEPEDPAQVLMSRLRIESPSFGRYQAGPRMTLEASDGARGWVEGKCLEEDCPEARNLSLLLRWRKRVLRQPFEEFRSGLCDRLRDESSSFSKGLADAGTSREEILSLCPGEVAAAEEVPGE